ncbi:MAG: DUF1573 domain-containing protein [Bacteroidota bacterium]
MEMKTGMWKLLCLLLLWCSCHDVSGQVEIEDFQFMESEYDFENVLESDMILKHTFQFLNVGDDSLAITNVEPSCGCIVPDWNREYIQSGDYGNVTIGFNPYNRPGRFEKEVLVSFTNGSTQKLEISGAVLNEQIFSKQYPYEHFNIRYEKRRFIFNGVQPKQSQSFLIRLFNNSDKPVALDSVGTISESRFTLNSESWSMEPGRWVVIEGVVIADEEPGYTEYGLRLYFKDQDIDPISLDIVQNVLKAASVDQEDGPMLAFDKTIIDIGEVKQGTVLNKTIEIQNAGTGNLEISDIVSNCGCLSVDYRNAKLKPGEKQLLYLILDTSAIDGIQQKGLHFYSNAVNGTLQQLMIKVKVVQ